MSTMPRLSGKRALVTAAGQGIGRATAIAFAQHGATVLATDINIESLAALDAQRHPGLSVARLDVTNREAIAALGDAHQAAASAFNVVFNCAGIVHSGTLLECDEHELQFAWELNVVAMYRICRALLPGMIAAGGGSIINMSSVASSVKAVPNRFAYSTSKAAVIGLTKSLATDFIGHGIRCNAICPGTVQTPSLTERIAAQARAQDTSATAIQAQFEARQPLGRLGRPEEIAALAVHLAADESAFTTGAVHIIDGGWCN
jgi:2-keto-3-deoxy-L-fuconate dehydrogenase